MVEPSTNHGLYQALYHGTDRGTVGAAVAHLRWVENSPNFFALTMVLKIAGNFSVCDFFDEKNRPKRNANLP